MPECKEYTLKVALTDEEWKAFDKYVHDMGIVKYRFVRQAILEKLTSLGYLPTEQKESK